MGPCAVHESKQGFLERETGFEPATSTLARSHSTTELLPLDEENYTAFAHYNTRSGRCRSVTAVFCPLGELYLDFFRRSIQFADAEAADLPRSSRLRLRRAAAAGFPARL